MFSLFVIIATVIIALLGPFIRPDSTPKSNDQNLEITLKQPGFALQILKVRKNDLEKEKTFFQKLLWGMESTYRTYPIYNYNFEGTDIVVEKYTGDTPNNGEVIRFNLADVAYPIDVNKHAFIEGNTINFYALDGKKYNLEIESLKSEVIAENIENRKYYLGTDRYGRDFLSRIMAGTWISLTVGLISVFISILIGVLMGALAGYFRGWIDDVIMWLINVVWSIPTLLLIIAITLAIGKDFWQVFVAVGLTMWVEVARVVRGQVLSIREKEFVEAGHALGFTNYRIIYRHILPNVMGPVVVISAANFAAAILIEAGLSFLGLGAPPPQATWGKIISEHRGYIFTGSGTEYLTIIPGVAIMILVLAFIFIGNGLRDSLDSKAQKDFTSL
jgi:peptide/nickel transport system permease protein